MRSGIRPSKAKTRTGADGLLTFVVASQPGGLVLFVGTGIGEEFSHVVVVILEGPRQRGEADFVS